MVATGAASGCVPTDGHSVRFLLLLRASIASEYGSGSCCGRYGSRFADRLGLRGPSRVHEPAADSTPNAILHAKEIVPIPHIRSAGRKRLDYWCRIPLWVGMVDGLGDGELNSLDAERG